jgi:hypothetical protein
MKKCHTIKLVLKIYEWKLLKNIELQEYGVCWNDFLTDGYD